MTIYILEHAVMKGYQAVLDVHDAGKEVRDRNAAPAALARGFCLLQE
jgi:hypothetical protein